FPALAWHEPVDRWQERGVPGLRLVPVPAGVWAVGAAGPAPDPSALAFRVRPDARNALLLLGGLDGAPLPADAVAGLGRSLAGGSLTVAWGGDPVLSSAAAMRLVAAGSGAPVRLRTAI